MAREMYIPCEILGAEGSMIPINAPRGAEDPHLIWAEREDVVIERQPANKASFDGFVKGSVSNATPTHLTIDVRGIGGWTLVTVPTEMATPVLKPTPTTAR